MYFPYFDLPERVVRYIAVPVTAVLMYSQLDIHAPPYTLMGPPERTSVDGQTSVLRGCETRANMFLSRIHAPQRWVFSTSASQLQMGSDVPTLYST